MSAAPAPLAVPPDAREVMLFGGTFDPPTWAHVRIAELARRARAPAAWLVVVPAARSPHKDRAPHASDADRLAMARLAFEPVERCVVWSDEIDRRDGPSFTIDTVRRLRDLLSPDAKVFLLLGSDQAAAFHRWKDPRELLELAEPVVFVRAPDTSPQDCLNRMKASGAWTDADLRPWQGRILELSPVEGSATRAREALKCGKGADIVSPRVLDFVRRHGLYS